MKTRLKSSNILMKALLPALLFSLVLIACSKKTAEKEADLFGEFFTPYPDLITQRGDSAPSDRLKKALGFYAAQDYNSAITVFDEMILEYPANDSLNFYSGISYLATGKSIEAITRFEDVSDIEGSEFAIPAQWYLSLAYISSGDKTQAAVILAGLSKKKNSYQKKASDLLADLPYVEIDAAAEARKLDIEKKIIDVARETFKIDEDGFESYSYLDLGHDAEISIRATARNQNLFVRYNKLFTANSAIKIYNNRGRLMHQEDHDSVRGGNEVEINLDDLPGGTYSLFVRVDGLMIKQRMLLHGAM
jgi:hypothetical protein